MKKFVLFLFSLSFILISCDPITSDPTVPEEPVTPVVPETPEEPSDSAVDTNKHLPIEDFTALYYSDRYLRVDALNSYCQLSVGKDGSVEGKILDYIDAKASYELQFRYYQFAYFYLVSSDESNYIVCLVNGENLLGQSCYCASYKEFEGLSDLKSESLKPFVGNFANLKSNISPVGKLPTDTE